MDLAGPAPYIYAPKFLLNNDEQNDPASLSPVYIDHSPMEIVRNAEELSIYDLHSLFKQMLDSINSEQRPTGACERVLGHGARQTSVLHAT